MLILTDWWRLKKQRKESGNKLFYIVQIGNVQHPSMNFSAKKICLELLITINRK